MLQDLNDINYLNNYCTELTKWRVRDENSKLTRNIPSLNFDETLQVCGTVKSKGYLFLYLY